MQKYGEMWAWCWCFFDYWFLFWVVRVLDLNSRQVAVNLKQWFVVLIAFRKFFAAQSVSLPLLGPSPTPTPTLTSLQKSAGLPARAYQVKAVICVCGLCGLHTCLHGAWQSFRCFLSLPILFFKRRSHWIWNSWVELGWLAGQWACPHLSVLELQIGATTPGFLHGC